MRMVTLLVPTTLLVVAVLLVAVMVSAFEKSGADAEHQAHRSDAPISGKP